MSSQARKLADLLDTSGDVRVAHLDNAVVDLSDYYTKSQTDGKVVELSPPTDLTGYYTKTQVASIITTLKGGASAAFDTLGELELEIEDNEMAVVSNAAAIVAAQNAIITNHP
jgi:hypothetical protein